MTGYAATKKFTVTPGMTTSYWKWSFTELASDGNFRLRYFINKGHKE